MQDKIAMRLGVFAADEFDPILNNHELHGEYANYRSINITGNYRLIYKMIDHLNCLLINVGTHSQLYE